MEEWSGVLGHQRAGRAREYLGRLTRDHFFWVYSPEARAMLGKVCIGRWKDGIRAVSGRRAEDGRRSEDERQ